MDPSDLPTQIVQGLDREWVRGQGWEPIARCIPRFQLGTQCRRSSLGRLCVSVPCPRTSIQKVCYYMHATMRQQHQAAVAGFVSLDLALRLRAHLWDERGTTVCVVRAKETALLQVYQCSVVAIIRVFSTFKLHECI